MVSSVPFHEPDFLTILISSSFLLSANVLEYVLNRILYCGLLGPLFLGIAWGSPGAGLFNIESQVFISELGYIGLLLLVYEGGLSTSIPLLKANAALSSFVALTGILLPIGFSFVLVAIAEATPLQAFAAGAALCSTSLGTAFTVLTSSGLNATRLGVVLTSSAILDDVVGLVMLQIVSNLGISKAEFSPMLIVRPVLVSVGLVVVSFVLCWALVRPLTIKYYSMRQKRDNFRMRFICDSRHTPFIIHTLLLIGIVAVASYAQTSNLFAAYICGCCISWWDTIRNSLAPADPDPKATHLSSIPEDNREVHANGSTRNASSQTEFSSTSMMNLENRSHSSARNASARCGLDIFNSYFRPPVRFILRPFFFASMGFAIPITKMFDGDVVWKGIVYTLLMILGKLACGLWLIRSPGLSLCFGASPFRGASRKLSAWKSYLVSSNTSHQSREDTKKGRETGKTHEAAAKKEFSGPTAEVDFDEKKNSCERESSNMNHHGIETALFRSDSTGSKSQGHSTKIIGNQASEQQNSINRTAVSTEAQKPRKKELDSRSHATGDQKTSRIYPVAILGSAMVARGEIGFLISSVADSKGIFHNDGMENTSIFLIVTWAIMVCTIVGPVMMGVFVRRVRNYTEVNTSQREESNELLGVWGNNY